MTALLEVRNVRKAFIANGQPVPILADISISLNPSEIVALLGASGCGKTTLLRIILGLEQADGGSIESTLPRPGPDISYQSQNDRLLPWRSVIGNVALGPELCGTKSDAAASGAKPILKQVGLADFCDHYPGELSGGMTQRALLARTLALSPKLLLLDEPMSNLDIIARQELGGIIKSYVKDRQAAALIVTHSVEEACQISDRVLIISQKPSRIIEQIALDDENREQRVVDVHQALVRSIRGAA